MPLLTCPNDNAPMKEISRDGVSLDVCPECRGVWLDRGELEKLLGSVRAVEADWDREREGYRRAAPQPQPYRRDDDDDDDRYERGRKKKGLSRLLDIFD